MKRFDRPTNAVRLAVLATVLCTLAGCDTLNSWFASDRVDYKSAGSAPSLSIPPDLSAASEPKGKYVAPASTAGLGGLPERVKTVAGNATEGVPNAQDPYGMHIEHDGDHYWLVVDGRTPSQLWPQLEEFWQQNGFVLSTDSSDTGIMETDWAENRANIPNDWFRKTVGKLLDFAYSSGTRDKFRTLVERGAQGDSTDIFITHSAMEEMLVGQDQETSRWEDRPRSPQLEQAFLMRLMEKFGLTDAQAHQLVAQAQPAVQPAQIVDSSGGTPTLDLHEPFDSAWLRVGLALDRTNFVVDNSDRAKGIYYVRYTTSSANTKDSGLLGKFFSSKPKPPGQQYLVNVRANGASATQVAILDQSGQIDTSRDARRIVALLHAQLN